MVRLCTKLLTETELYDTDMEVRNLIDWVCVSEQIKENNNTIRNLAGEYKQIEPDCREGVREKLERMKELCKCIKLLSMIAKSKPELKCDIVSALQKADVSIYADSMQLLVYKDIQKSLAEIQ